MEGILEPKDIKRIRKMAGLTQRQLADFAGVSQSLIAKIESGLIDPSYSKMTQITQALERLLRGEEVKAEQIMMKEIIYGGAEQSLREVASTMVGKAISQMPVRVGDNIIGIITEARLVNGIASGLDPDKTKVKAVMEEPPPILPKDATIGVLSHVLRFFPMALISDKGRVVGLVTKSDLLNAYYKR